MKDVVFLIFVAYLTSDSDFNTIDVCPPQEKALSYCYGHAEDLGMRLLKSDIAVAMLLPSWNRLRILIHVPRVLFPPPGSLRKLCGAVRPGNLFKRRG